MKNAILTFMMIALLGLSACSGGGSSDDGGSETETLLVSGQISDTNSAPISGATVAIDSETLLSVRSTQIKAVGDEGTTNENGFFSIEVTKEKGKAYTFTFKVTYNGNEIGKFEVTINADNTLSTDKPPVVISGADAITLGDLEDFGVEFKAPDSIPVIAGTYSSTVKLTDNSDVTTILKGISVVNENNEVELGPFTYGYTFDVSASDVSLQIPIDSLTVEADCTYIEKVSLVCAQDIPAGVWDYKKIEVAMAYKDSTETVGTAISPVDTSFEPDGTDDSDWDAGDASKYTDDTAGDILASDTPDAANIDYVRIGKSNDNFSFYFFIQTKGSDLLIMNDTVVYHIVLYNGEYENFHFEVSSAGDFEEPALHVDGNSESFVNFDTYASSSGLEIRMYTYSVSGITTFDIAELTNMGIIFYTTDADGNFYDYFSPLQLFSFPELQETPS